MDNAGDAVRILVIDEDPASQTEFCGILAFNEAGRESDPGEMELFRDLPSAADPLRFAVETATHGEEGWQKARAASASRQPFAVAFIDVRPGPGWDGVETTAQLWRENPDLQVVLCSSSSDYSWRAMVRKLGISDRLLILRKPFDQVEVLQLAHALARKWLLAREVREKLENLGARIAIRNADLERANTQLRAEIAERNAALEALRAAEDRFALAFRASPMGMVMEALADGRFVEINEAGAALFGRPRESIIGQIGDEIGLWADPSQHEEVRLLLRAGEPVRHFDCQLRDGHGRVRQVKLWGERFVWRGRDHLLLIAEDVTDLENLETQLRQAQKMEAVGSLAAGVAHEFNNILTVIQGHLSLQLDRGALSDDTRESLRIAFTASERAAALTHRLLTCTRQQVIAREPLDLAAVLGDTRALLTRTLGEQIEQRWEMGSVHPIVVGEAGAIEQIVLNLALNARDAMPDGGTLTLRLEHLALETTPHARARPGEYARLTVADHGRGISPENLPRIFEPFFTTKSPGTGTGLGLAVVYAIVDKLDGWIDVESVPGKGTTFHVYLPASTTTRVEEGPTFTAPLDGKARTILIVEDEEMLIYLLQGILTMNGHEVITAPDGQAALQSWAEHRAEIDLVITDMVMPGGISGRVLGERLHAEVPALPIIYTSGYSPDFVGADLILTPGVNFLPKPYTTQAVLEIVAKAFRRD
ncbi:MAG: ATP-binding protein [Chthoniobacteraceae bacterium]